MRRLILSFGCTSCSAAILYAAPDSQTKTSAEMRRLHGAVCTLHSEMVVPAMQPGPKQVNGDPYVQNDVRFDRQGWVIESTSYVAGEKSMQAIFRREGPVILVIFSVTVHTVALQTREIGIRMALLRMVLRRGAILMLAGMAVGLAGSFAATR